MISKQDESLAKAAIQLYQAGNNAAVPFEGTDEDFANFCIQTVVRFFADLNCEPDDTQTLSVYVFSELKLDTSNIV